MPPTSQMMTSPLAEAAHSHVDSLTASNQGQQLHEAQAQPNNVPEVTERVVAPSQRPQPTLSREEQPEKEYVSKIGILTTSLPMYHNQIMKAKKEDEERRRAEAEGEPLEPREAEMLSKMSLEVGSDYQTSEQQAETLRRLKPHSRSTVHIQHILSAASKDSEEAAAHAAKPKTKNTKWQFGIRSKNEPVDAVKCLYKALKAMGDCQWHVPPPKSSAPDTDSHDGGPFPVNVAGATHLSSGAPNLSESPEKDRHHAPDAHRTADPDPTPIAADGPSKPRPAAPKSAYFPDDSDSENDSDIDIDNPPPGYFPKDPWCIHVRWEKTGMGPIGSVNSNSAQSSHVDLSSPDGSARRDSIALGSLSSAAGSATSVTGGVGPLTHNFDNTACFVYMDLQIYTIEVDNYLVDFKLAGYESIIGSKEVVNKKGETITEYIGSGVRIHDKDVTSPQPFLDLANRLVIHLANKN